MKNLFIKRKKYTGSKEHQTFVKKEKTKTFLVHFSRITLLIALMWLLSEGIVNLILSKFGFV